MKMSEALKRKVMSPKMQAAVIGKVSSPRIMSADTHWSWNGPENPPFKCSPMATTIYDKS